MSYPKFIIKNSSNNQFYFNLHAVNSEIILTSEMYTTKQNCLVGIQSVKTNAPFDANYDKEISTNNKYYFNLKAVNHQIIGKSEMYNSIQNRENGIEAVKRDAPIASIEDLS